MIAGALLGYILVQQVTGKVHCSALLQVLAAR
jgi:hypothetical protein